MQINSKTAQIIISALPYIRKFRDKVFVIKYGGAAQIDDELKANFARDIVLLNMVGIKTIIVHGGGKKIGEYLEKIGIKSEFRDGLRVSNADAIDVVEMVLCGLINKEITALLTQNGVKSIGISGKDNAFLKARILDDGKYGFVGKICGVNTQILDDLLRENYVPVIAPLASDENGQS